MSSRFGGMLLNRRRELGMSIQQVANVIKIRPQIIEYFETANFAAMPPRGYAQGMISSYARYLGLNPREVVDAYFDELGTYERVHNTGAGRFQDSVAEASPHSDNTTGRFMMVNAVPASRYAQRPPQAGYVSESHSPHEPVPASRLRREPPYPRTGQRPLPPASDGSPREPRRPYGQPAGSQRRGQRPTPSGAGLVRAQAPQRAPYNQQARGSARQAGPQGGPSRPRRPAPSSGLASIDPRLLYAIIGLLIVLILVASAALFKGCSADKPADNPPAAAQGSAEPEDKANEDDEGDTPDEPVQDPASDDPASSADAASQTDADAVPKETKIKISIAKGKTSWIEVKLDGKGDFADTVVGPFSKEYTVAQSIEISVTNPADVVITKNGEKVRYDSKSSGVGRVTITVPKPAVVDEDGDGQPDDTSADAAQSDSNQTGE